MAVAGHVYLTGAVFFLAVGMHNSPRSPATKAGLTVSDTMATFFKLNGIKGKPTQLHNLVKPLRSVLTEQRVKVYNENMRNDEHFTV
jgi:hypothetical protein